MGVRTLDRYLRKLSNPGMSLQALHVLSNRTVAVDALQYVYRAAAQGDLHRRLRNLAALLQNMGIRAVFVFDGVPPVQKHDRLKARNKARSAAASCAAGTHSAHSPVKPVSWHKRLTAQSLTRADITGAMATLVSCGSIVVRAHGEAEVLCTALVAIGMAYAVLSDDTDVFPLGCPRVCRRLSQVKQTLIMCEVPRMLSHMGVSLSQFRKACVACGTDFNEPVCANMRFETAIADPAVFKPGERELAALALYEQCDTYERAMKIAESISFSVNVIIGDAQITAQQDRGENTVDMRGANAPAAAQEHETWPRGQPQPQPYA